MRGAGHTPVNGKRGSMRGTKTRAAVAALAAGAGMAVAVAVLVGGEIGRAMMGAW